MLIWKHRRFAIAIFYYECIVLLVHGFVPYDYGAIGDFFALLTVYSFLLGYSCDLGRNGIAIIATYLIQTLLILPKINHDESITFNKVFGRLYDSVMGFVICLILTLTV